MGDLAIRVQPRAKRTEIAGERGGTVVIRVAVTSSCGSKD
jgi:uncharacterized protein YggU (UPF0235/DUF167 family)